MANEIEGLYLCLYSHLLGNRKVCDPKVETELCELAHSFLVAQRGHTLGEVQRPRRGGRRILHVSHRSSDVWVGPQVLESSKLGRLSRLRPNKSRQIHVGVDAIGHVHSAGCVFQHAHIDAII
ncbi:g9285 [Coccomyxa viridis]|uniref:G9285 protein n=1 Tax=Coccomyxa viridis TaxID=1274662 RepID=A0ABP1G6Q3_9CHLO